MSTSIPLESRVEGALLGLAVCDALGGPVEFKSRGTFSRVEDMLPNHNFGLPPGCFTDDTSMALCLAQSLVDNGGQSNILDQVRKYISWWTTGYLSSTGACFDIGVSTCQVLERWSEHLETDYEHLNPESKAAQDALDEIVQKIERVYNQEAFCGNGSLMRVLPAALVARDEAHAVQLARDSSQPTHPHARCVDACALYARLVFHALGRASKAELAATLSRLLHDESGPQLEPVLRARLQGYQSLADWKAKPESDIRSTGYVVDSLEASLWAFFSTDGFQDGAVRVVNLGDDADTVGAIYGGLAGAHYGGGEIPSTWLQAMHRMDLLNELVEKILMLRAGPT